VAAGKRSEEGHPPPSGTVQGEAAFGGAKIWNSEIWPLLANWRLHFWQLQLINLRSIALRNYTPT